MTKRIVVGLLGLAALLALVLRLAFPTDQLVRRALAGVRLPGGTRLEFATATLRPWGLRLDGVALRRADATKVLDAQWLRLRPSLLGLLTGGPGFPWTAAAAVCGGEIAVRVDDDGTTRGLDARWTDLDLAPCLQRPGSHPALTGRFGGTATLRSVPGAPRPTGNGEVALRDAVWEPAIPWLDETALHADSAFLRWTLGTGLLTVERLDVRGPDLELVADGDARLRESLQESELRLRVELTPMPGMSHQLRSLLQGLPRQADGTYAFRVSGPLRAPRVGPE